MNGDDVSLLISIIAAIIAAIALGWNIYRDVILKAKVKVSLHVVTLYHEELPEKPEFIRISVTNFGPGRNWGHCLILHSFSRRAIVPG